MLHRVVKPLHSREPGIKNAVVHPANRDRGDERQKCTFSFVNFEKLSHRDGPHTRDRVGYSHGLVGTQGQFLHQSLPCLAGALATGCSLSICFGVKISGVFIIGLIFIIIVVVLLWRDFLLCSCFHLSPSLGFSSLLGDARLFFLDVTDHTDQFVQF